MSIYINRGNEGFRSTRNGEYVDKSILISIVNSTLYTRQRFSRVTRSRRFGKTMAAKMRKKCQPSNISNTGTRNNT